MVAVADAPGVPWPEEVRRCKAVAELAARPESTKGRRQLWMKSERLQLAAC